jgi:Ni/Co efflux regulator RcnB
MKSLIEAAVIAALIAAPLAAFAQSSQPLTRAEVRAQLVDLEKAGYNPRDWMNYREHSSRRSSCCRRKG